VALVNLAALGAAAAAGAAARPTQSHPPQRSQAPPPRPPSQPANRPPAGAAQHRPNTQHQPNNGSNRPPATMTEPPRSNNFNNRPNETGPAAALRPRQQVGVGAPRPFVDRMRDLNPQQRDRVLQSSRAFQNLAPEQQNRIRQQFNQWDHLNAQQRADLRAKEDTWRRMTPEQRSYVKNDVLPKWRQIPWERQQVIQQKLGVLQNMPESARNRRLSDPNFTRGMSDEDKQTLHDLSHLHVGGAPDPPGNE
jgi:Protein of unknown function (DUF3106)